MTTPTLCHVTGIAYAVGQTGNGLTYAPVGTRITLTPVSVTGQAIFSGAARTSVGANGAVDFYVIKNAQVTISGSIKGFTGTGATVQIPDEDSYAFESLVNITLTPASFGNPMTSQHDLIVGGVGGAAQRLGKGSNGQVLTITAGVVGWGNSSGTGTVTSVDLSVPSFLSVAGNPITSAGTLALSLANQSASRIFAGPGTGSAAAPTFRALVAADIPDLSGVYAAATHNQAWSTITATPTTLSGYGITDAQPLDSDLTAIAALTTTSFGRGLLTESSAATARSTLALVVGTNVQAFNSNLSTYASITPSANVQTLLGSADYATFRTSLGLGTLATQSGTFSGTSSGTNTGDQSLNSLLPSQTGHSGEYLTTNGTNASWAVASGGGGTPGGSDTQVQFNDSSAFGGDAGLTYNKTTKKLSIEAGVNDTWLSLKYSSSEYVKSGFDGSGGYGLFSGGVFGNSNGYAIGSSPTIYAANTWSVGTTGAAFITGSNASNTVPYLTFNAVGLTDKPGLRINQSASTTADPLAINLNSVLVFHVAPTGQPAITAVAFASLPSSPTEGMIAAVTDSSTNTWGATISGGGSNHVLGYFNGVNWTVVAK